MRVFRFGARPASRQMGAYIDDGGTNFWGVEQFTAADGERLIAGSDRDYGLEILRYTGPGAVGPTPASPALRRRRVPKDGSLHVTRGRSPRARRSSASDFGEQIDRHGGRGHRRREGGDDCVDGLGGDDELRGGAGVDTFDGQRGNDRLRGDSGRGNLRGGTGNDRVTGGSVRDTLVGNTGRDRVSGGVGNDSLFGGAGNDRLTGGKGKDVIEGGTGNDRIFAKNGRADRIDCGFGKDTAASRDRSDPLTSCEKQASLKKEELQALAAPDPHEKCRGAAARPPLVRSG